MTRRVLIALISIVVLLGSLWGCEELLRQITDITTPTITIGGTVSLPLGVATGSNVWIGLLTTSPVTPPSDVQGWNMYQQLAIAPGASSRYSFSEVEAGKYVVVAFYDLNNNAIYDTGEPFGGYPAPNGYPLYNFNADTSGANVTIASAAGVPDIGLSLSALNFFATDGGGNPAAQTAAVVNTGGGSLSGLSTSISYSGAAGWLSATLSATSAPATLTVQPSVGTLSAGTYTAIVTVASSLAGTTSQAVTVTLTVTSASTPPAMWLSASVVSYSTTVGGASPGAQTVDVMNTGGGILSGLSRSISYGGAVTGWLTASLSATTAPAVLTITPSTASLAAGIYTATVVVSSSVSGVASQNVSVALEVAQIPAIGLTPSSINFYAVAGGGNPASGSVSVSNTGGGVLSGLSASVSYGQGQPTGWLSVSVPSTAPCTLTAQALTGSLSAGSYAATINVSSSIAGVTAQSVIVVFSVSAQASTPAIGLSTSTLGFSSVEGGTNPNSQTVTVSNSGGGTLSGLSASIGYTGGTSGWLTATLQATTASTTLTAQATTGSLAAGIYTATITVSSSLSGVSSQAVNVTFTVTPPPPEIVLAPASVSISSMTGSADPSPQTVAVSNGGGGTLNGLSVAVAYGSGSGWLDATLGSTTANTTLTLQAHTGTLAAGSYMAMVTVSSSVAGVGAQFSSVTFTVSQGPIIELSAVDANFFAVQGGADPSARTIDIDNAGGGSLSGLSTDIDYGSGSGWLTVSLNATTAPTTLTVQATTGALTAGTYTATITVASTLPGVSSKNIAINFSVSEELVPAIGLSSSTVSFTATSGAAIPLAQQVQVFNAGTGTLSGLDVSVSYDEGDGWLDVSLDSDTAETSLTIQPNTAALISGEYTATVTVSSSLSGVESESLSVIYTVLPVPPEIGLSQTTLSFSAVAGGSNPASQTVLVTNLGELPLNGLYLDIEYGTGSAWLLVTMNTSTAPATITISPLAGSLAADTYTATVYVSSAVAVNSPQAIDVTFELTQYMLTLQAGTGGAITSPATSPVAVNHGAATSIVAEPDTGYGFVNWTVFDGTGADFGSKTSANTTVTLTDGDATIQANFAFAQYTVSFDPQEGTTPEPAAIQVTYSSTYGTLATTSRTGYTFGGWWTGTGGTGTEVTDSTVVTITADETLYAKWTANNYTVIFDSQSGSTPSPDSKVVTYGSTYGTLATTSRAGYTFGGWWTGTGGTGTEVTDSTTVTITADETLYAKWTANTYTVTFDGQSGSTPSPTSKVVTYGSTYGTLATTSRAGYTFGGWWTGAGGTGTQINALTTVTITADQTLYARWTANSYTVIFDAQSGSTPSPAAKLVTYDSTYGVLATTTRSGFTFSGWWTGSGGTGTEVIDSTTVTITANQTLYAKWTANTYAVTFDAQSGSTPSPTSKVVTYGSTYGTLATTSRTGYTLSGWWTGTGGTGTQITSSTAVTITANQTLYAKWTINTYTVSYNGNGSSLGQVPTSVQYSYGANVVVSGLGNLRGPAIVSNITQRFLAWNTQPGGGGTSYQPSGTFAMPANDVTLYAIWTTTGTAIGKIGQTGGFVFYDSGSYALGWRYMEAAPNDQSAGIAWGGYGTSMGTPAAIGTGETNTEYIVNHVPSGTYAALICFDLILGGQNDWFLPSQDELHLMYSNLKAAGIGGFAIDPFYWSSTAASATTTISWSEDFEDGFQTQVNRSNSLRVRAARTF